MRDAEIESIMSHILGVPEQNFEKRVDDGYEIIEVLINTESVGTVDDFRQIKEQTGYAYDSYRVQPRYGITLMFVRNMGI